MVLGGQRLSLESGDAGAPGHGTRAASVEDGAAAREGLASFAERIAGAGGGLGAGDMDEGAWARGERGGWAGTDGAGERGMSGREALLGSSFDLTLGDGTHGPGETAWTAWGRAAASRFDGVADGLTLDGDVTTVTLGADMAHERWLAGLAVSLSEGEGAFRDHAPAAGDEDHPARGSGELESTLTAVHPYARLDVSERLTVWGVLGYGTGDLTLALGGGERMTTGTEMRMAAAGARGVLVPGGDGGIEIAARTDGQLVRMTSEAATGTAGGNFAASASATSRVRLTLEGSRSLALEGGRTLRPSFEVGLRHDGGDAETGAGIEFGGGSSYTDPARGLTVEAKARGLVAHEDADYAEWGASGSVRIAPGASGRGLSLTLAPAWGAADGDAERLWSLGDARGLPGDDGSEPGSRLDAEVGYGFAVLGGRGVATPHAGLRRSGESEALRLGQRLKLDASLWSVESEFAEDHRTLRAGYGYRPGDALELSLEATRREPSDDGAPEHGVMLRIRARW